MPSGCLLFRSWQAASEYPNSISSCKGFTFLFSFLFSEETGEIPLLLHINNAHIGRSFLSMKLWRRGWHFKGEPEGKRGRSWHRRMSGRDTRHLWTSNTKCCLSVYHKHAPHTVLSPILMSPVWIIEVIGNHWTSIVQAHICCCL